MASFNYRDLHLSWTIRLRCHLHTLSERHSCFFRVMSLSLSREHHHFPFALRAWKHMSCSCECSLFWLFVLSTTPTLLGYAKKTRSFVHVNANHLAYIGTCVPTGTLHFVPLPMMMVDSSSGKSRSAIVSCRTTASCGIVFWNGCASSQSWLRQQAGVNQV